MIEPGQHIYWLRRLRALGIARHAVCEVTAAYQRHLDALADEDKAHRVAAAKDTLERAVALAQSSPVARRWLEERLRETPAPATQPPGTWAHPLPVPSDDAPIH